MGVRSNAHASFVWVGTRTAAAGWPCVLRTACVSRLAIDLSDCITEPTTLPGLRRGSRPLCDGSSQLSGRPVPDPSVDELGGLVVEDPVAGEVRSDRQGDAELDVAKLVQEMGV